MHVDALIAHWSGAQQFESEVQGAAALAQELGTTVVDAFVDDTCELVVDLEAEADVLLAVADVLLAVGVESVAAGSGVESCVEVVEISVCELEVKQVSHRSTPPRAWCRLTAFCYFHDLLCQFPKLSAK